MKTNVLMLVSLLSVGALAQPLTAAELPAEFTRGLTPGQVQVALEGLRRAGAPACDTSDQCVRASLQQLRIATQLARESRTAAQIASAIGLPAEPEVEAPVRVFVEIPPGAPSRGPANAPVTVVTWLDYQCPFSAKLNTTFKELEKKYPGKVRFVVRHLPLPFHTDAKALAAMSLTLGKSTLWEFHDRLFALGGAANRATAEAIARQLRVDTPSLRTAPESKMVIDRLQRHLDDAAALGVNATPVSFVNGFRVDGAVELAQWENVIDEELKK